MSVEVRFWREKPVHSTRLSQSSHLDFHFLLEYKEGSKSALTPRMRHLRPFVVRTFEILLSVATISLWAETGVLVVHVKDIQQRAIGGVQIGVTGDGGTSIT